MEDKSKLTPVTANPWQQLRQFTKARIALGRAGMSLPTGPHLEFQFAHAQARDAVHLPFDGQALQQQLTEKGYEVIRLHSAAADRHIYLQRPDLGRRLDRDSRHHMEAKAPADYEATLLKTAPPSSLSAKEPHAYDVALVIADGLSALAVHQNAAPFLEVMAAKLQQEGWRIAPVVLVEQGRVAIGDEIGELLRAAMVVVLIGERPGLSSPDSLGIYFTYRPRTGLTDADRNCISNVRREGLSFAVAAHKLFYLMSEARRRKLSGVGLKDEAGVPERTLKQPDAANNFLLDRE